MSMHLCFTHTPSRNRVWTLLCVSPLSNWNNRLHVLTCETSRCCSPEAQTFERRDPVSSCYLTMEAENDSKLRPCFASARTFWDSRVFPFLIDILRHLRAVRSLDCKTTAAMASRSGVEASRAGAEELGLLTGGGQSLLL